MYRSTGQILILLLYFFSPSPSTLKPARQEKINKYMNVYECVLCMDITGIYTMHNIYNNVVYLILFSIVNADEWVNSKYLYIYIYVQFSLAFIDLAILLTKG